MFQTILQTAKMYDLRKAAFYAEKIGSILVFVVIMRRNSICNFYSVLLPKQAVAGSNPVSRSKKTRDFQL